MSVADNQQRTFLRLAASLRPHWRRDPALPARLQQRLARERAFGARDRRLYRELLYTTLRYLPWIEPLLDSSPDQAVAVVAWLAAETPATSRFRAAAPSSTWPPCPASVSEKTVLAAARLGLAPDALPAPLPAWFHRHCPEAFVSPNLDALLARAPLWLRLQTDDPARITDEFAARGWRWRTSAVLPSALELLAEADITTSDAFAHGFVEVQDLGSQLVLESCGLAPGERWLDACAGAGGKTLQLARRLGPRGHVDAHDIRPAALAELSARAARAGVSNLSLLRAPATESYDGVLVDAPCSGSGTWRRAPHLKWTTTESRVTAVAATQLALLRDLAPRVRSGGRLVYATCSLSRVENAEVVAAFLATHPEFSAEPPACDFGASRGDLGLTIFPALHDTDGFFVASLRRA